MAVQLPATSPLREVGLCRHCDQPLRYKPNPYPDEPDYTDHFIGLDSDGTSTLACFGPTAITYDCPNCYGTRFDSDGYKCESCDGSGLTADHAPAEFSVVAA